MRRVIETSHAVAIAAKLCKPSVIPVYPITPQTHIVERLAEFISNGELNSEMINSESEHSALSSAVGAQATGVRTFTATASQGLALMHEVVFIASGLRLPIVMAVANRSLSSPINIWGDHQDSISERDSGWIQIYAETAQEAFDSIIHAYRIAEDKEILLPVMVCIDGFSLSHVYEEVDIPEQNLVDRFLPGYKPINAFLNPEKPVTQGAIAFPNTYMDFKLEQENAIENSAAVIKKANSEFKGLFGRGYGDGLIETYKMEKAKYGIIAMGSVCGTIKEVIDKLDGKIGLIRIRAFRPFPKKELLYACRNLKAVAVIDRNISLGQEGALLSEIKALLFSEKKRPLVKGFILGLGGREIGLNHINLIAKKVTNNEEKTEWLL